MKSLVIALIILLIVLQYKLWYNPSGIREVFRLKESIALLKKDNENLKMRNLQLEADVQDLKQGSEAIEERARNDLGMVRKGEVFYQIIEK